MARPDGVSPAQPFYNRRMKQLLPILPAQAENAEVDIRARDEAGERAERNSNKCTVRLSNAHIESWNGTNYISIEKEACRACTRIAREQTRKGVL